MFFLFLKSTFLTFLDFSNTGDSASYNNMHLKETEQNNGRENTYLVSTHNSFINLCQF